MKKIFLIFFVPILLFAESGGMTNATKKNGTGCHCHSPSASASVSVIISGPDTIKIGETKNYTVTISGGPLSAAGFNVAISSGTLGVISGQGARLFQTELTHSAPKVKSGSSVTFTFAYSPASTGEVIMFATGNSVNLNGGNSGDAWNHATNKIIRVTPTTNISENISPIASYKLNQNYPNPFNPSTIISYQLSMNSFVTLIVYDVLGNEMATLVNKKQNVGLYNYNFDAKNLPSGNYFYRIAIHSDKLTTNEFTKTKKMILLK